VLLNQVALQHQGFQLGICQDIFKPCNMGHHLFNFGRLIPAALEILPDPVLKADGLAHIYNLIPVIVHKINSRTGREFLQFFL